MPFPLVKLGYLFLRQMGKHVAIALKARTAKSPWFKNFCSAIANRYQQYDVNARLKLKGMGKSTAVQKMTPEQAADIGADIVGELIVYSILALLVVSEYYYYARAAELKEQDRKEEWNRLARKMDDLIFTTEKQDTEIKELRRIIFDIHEKNCSLFEKLKNNRGLLEKLLSKEKKG